MILWNLNLHLKELEKEQMKPKISRKKEITKMSGEISEMKTKKTTEEVWKTQNWFSEKINKIGKSLARLTKKKTGLN